MIPDAAFEPLIEELINHPIAVVPHRIVAGPGRTLNLGMTRRWSYIPYISRDTWKRPHLWQLALEFAKNHLPPSFHWTTITINDSYETNWHFDKGNAGPSAIISFGDFTGGGLHIINPDGSESVINTRNQLYFFNGATTRHKTGAFEGRRFCMVFYTLLWPVRFGDPYSVTITEEEGLLRVANTYNDEDVVLDKKGHVVKTYAQGRPRKYYLRVVGKGGPALTGLSDSESEDLEDHSSE
ncbi:MAG: hypothetical protein EB117_14775 [Betaproteobacteria bacterium]|nr:hypothetical protein [Betaproteobacteria bacterium]